jgi:hypothetical protein
MKAFNVILMFALLGLVVVQAPTTADSKPAADLHYRMVPWPVGTRVSLEVLINDRPQPTIHYAGKTWLPVRTLGEEYTIRVTNHGPRRVTALVSVDGLGVLNGQPASEDHPGYIVAPYSNIVIKGWRRNMEAVAAFRFVDRETSYAKEVGRPENIGVIGLVAFEEMVWHPRLEREPLRLNVPAKERHADAGSIGTEYGRELDSKIYYVDFVRSDRRHAVTIYYDTIEALREAGVPVDAPAPRPFPGNQFGDRFAPPPPGYEGREDSMNLPPLSGEW